MNGICDESVWLKSLAHDVNWTKNLIGSLMYSVAHSWLEEFLKQCYCCVCSGVSQGQEPEKLPCKVRTYPGQ